MTDPSRGLGFRVSGFDQEIRSRTKSLDLAGSCLNHRLELLHGPLEVSVQGSKVGCENLGNEKHVGKKQWV